MSKIENEEQTVLNSNGNSFDVKDDTRNKSKSTSPVNHNQKEEHRQPRMVKSASQGSTPAGLQHSATPEHMRGATKDMFDLIERAQCSRLDDQRCVLPAYFSQNPTLLHAALASTSRQVYELGTTGGEEETARKRILSEIKKTM